MANRVYRCPNCGGELEWSPSAQKLRCPYCGSEFDLSAFDQKEEGIGQELDTDSYEKGEDAEYASAADATDDSAVNPQDLRVYRCRNCGAEIITDKTTMATSCAFCNSPVVLTEQLDTDFRPKWILPFRIERKQVEKIYLDYVKSRPFTPAEFTSRAQIEKIKGIYIPFWIYHMELRGALDATGEMVTTTSDRDYVYTHHRVFHIVRDGEVSIDKLPVDASSKTPNDAMDSIEPFEYKYLQPFRMSYMAGFLAERYDEDMDQCMNRAMLRARNTVEQKLAATISGYSSLHVTNRTIDLLPGTRAQADYAMLPVYLLFTKYHGKDYLFAVNGQTGKAVGNVPISKKRAALFCAPLFGILFAILSVLTYLFF